MHTSWQLEMTRRTFPLTKGKRACSWFNVWRMVVFEPLPRYLNTARFNKRQTCDTNSFCYRSMPECWDDIVQCKLCEEWLHMSCEVFKTAPKGEWLCIVCRPPNSSRLRNCQVVILDPSTVNNR